MDVWFDSGSTHAAVLDASNPDLRWPADLYLEGADQYRGWFQSSLLTSVAWQGRRTLQGGLHPRLGGGRRRPQDDAKSLGNGIAPQEITDKYGADILRLWVASSDYHADIRISNGHLQAAFRGLPQDPQHRPLHPGQSLTTLTRIPIRLPLSSCTEPGPLGAGAPGRADAKACSDGLRRVRVPSGLPRHPQLLHHRPVQLLSGCHQGPALCGKAGFG